VVSKTPRFSARIDRAGSPSVAGDVLIVEEYIPEYRSRFFELLEGALGSECIRLTVAVGRGASSLAARSDSVEMPIMRRVPARSISVAGRRLTYRRLSDLTAGADLVIVDQALRHLENYPLLLRQRRGPKIGLWGHGTRLAKRATRLERLAERRVAKSAHWFFAYTERGAEHVAASGLPRERITVVQNALDVRELAELRRGVSADERRVLRDELGLPTRSVCLYVGALDASKRIGFLLDACSIVASRIPDFTLVVAGDGPERAALERSLVRYPWLRYVGRATGQQKARLGSVSDILLMPGSVGLVAVDSFALRTPIVTTHWPYHGPEFDYLEDGVNARITGDSVAEFAQGVENVLLAREELARLKAACAEATSRYSVENMVSRFTGGVVKALETPRR
jgi:glycosyltransferase involved in cell wall biosynthesis